MSLEDQIVELVRERGPLTVPEINEALELDLTVSSFGRTQNVVELDYRLVRMEDRKNVWGGDWSLWKVREW